MRQPGSPVAAFCPSTLPQKQATVTEKKQQLGYPARAETEPRRTSTAAPASQLVLRLLAHSAGGEQPILRFQVVGGRNASVIPGVGGSGWGAGTQFH